MTRPQNCPRFLALLTAVALFGCAAPDPKPQPAPTSDRYANAYGVPAANPTFDGLRYDETTECLWVFGDGSQQNTHVVKVKGYKPNPDARVFADASKAWDLGHHTFPDFSAETGNGTPTWEFTMPMPFKVERAFGATATPLRPANGPDISWVSMDTTTTGTSDPRFNFKVAYRLYTTGGNLTTAQPDNAQLAAQSKYTSWYAYCATAMPPNLIQQIIAAAK